MTDAELVALKIDPKVKELARFGLWAQERVIPLLRKLPPSTPLRQSYVKGEWKEVSSLVSEETKKSYDKLGIAICTTIESEVGRAFKDAPQNET